MSKARRLFRIRPALRALLTGFCAVCWQPVFAQELEPRAYSVSPVGVNILVLSYMNSQGDVVFDPTLPVEDATATINTAVLGYVRSVDFFGRSANVAVQIPYTVGTAKGRAFGDFQSIRRSGLPDSRLRFSVNLRGAPAMNLGEFVQYRQKTNLGTSFVLIPPNGQYDPNKLINLGSNRWAFKPELGLSRAFGRWVLDLYGGVWLFSANKNFTGSTRQQDPIGTSQVHLSYTLRRRLWVAFNANYFVGGRTAVDGIRRFDLQRNSRLGATISVPVGKRQSIRFAYSSGAFTTVGADFKRVAVAYQYLWGGGL